MWTTFPREPSWKEQKKYLFPGKTGKRNWGRLSTDDHRKNDTNLISFIHEERERCLLALFAGPTLLFVALAIRRSAASLALLFDSRRTTCANGVFPGCTSRKDTICAHGMDHGDIGENNVHELPAKLG